MFAIGFEIIVALRFVKLHAFDPSWLILIAFPQGAKAQINTKGKPKCSGIISSKRANKFGWYFRAPGKAHQR